MLWIITMVFWKRKPSLRRSSWRRCERESSEPFDVTQIYF